MRRRRVRPRPAALVVLLAAGLAVAGCGSSTSKSSKDSTTGSSAADPHGKITVVYDQPANQVAVLARQILKVGGTDGVAAGFTKSFKLNHNIRIHVVNGLVGPNYNPANKTITLSYGFVDFTAGVLKKNFPELRTNGEEFGRQLAAVDGFILVHEFGHTLIDIYDLPVLGKEEDAADAVATVFLTRSVNNGAEYAFDAARFFNALSSRQRNLAPADYFDEHSLDKQRAYSIVCWIAGSSRQNYIDVAHLHILSAAREQTCPSEYQQKVSATEQLLRSHVRA